MDTQTETSTGNNPIDTSTVVPAANTNTTVTTVSPKIKKKKVSKRKTIKDKDDKQNIRLSIKVRVADQMTEIADKRGMSSTLTLYRLYIEEGIEADLKRLAEQETMNEIVVREAINTIMGNKSDS